METCKVYRMVYDDTTKGDCGNGCDGFLGEFEVLILLLEDAWRYDFIGRNIADNKLYSIRSWEVTGIGGGMGSCVEPLPDNLKIEIADDKPSAYVDFSDKDIDDMLFVVITSTAMQMTDLVQSFSDGRQTITLIMDDGHKEEFKLPFPELREKNAFSSIPEEEIKDIDLIQRMYGDNAASIAHMFDRLSEAESFIERRSGNRVYLNPIHLLVIPFLMDFKDGDLVNVKDIYYRQTNFVTYAIKRFCKTREEKIKFLDQVMDWRDMYKEKPKQDENT